MEKLGLFTLLSQPWARKDDGGAGWRARSRTEEQEAADTPVLSTPEKLAVTALTLTLPGPWASKPGWLGPEFQPLVCTRRQKVV